MDLLTTAVSTRRGGFTKWDPPTLANTDAPFSSPPRHQTRVRLKWISPLTTKLTDEISHSHSRHSPTHPHTSATPQRRNVRSWPSSQCTAVRSTHSLTLCSESDLANTPRDPTILFARLVQPTSRNKGSGNGPRQGKVLVSIYTHSDSETERESGGGEGEKGDSS